jgi:hypothetical protein
MRSVPDASSVARGREARRRSAPAAKLLGLLAVALVALFATVASASAQRAPLVAMGAISEVSYASAHLSGSLTAGTPDGGNWGFEYTTTPADPASWAGAPNNGYGPSASPVTVEENLTGLKGGTKYFVRLAANNYEDPVAVSPEPYAEFTTLPVTPPAVLATDNASEVFYTTAEAKGEIERPANPVSPPFDPNSAFNTNCTFEYISDEQFSANQGASLPGFEGATPVSCDPPNPVEAPGASPAAAKLTGLAPSTVYHLRLSASNAGGADHKEAASTFTTLGPVPAPTVVSTDNASEVFYTTAEAKGKVKRPGGPGGADVALDTSCQFEYVTDAQFQANVTNIGPEAGFEGATPIGCEQGPFTVPGEEATVSAKLSGLAPGTTYHLRLSATNTGGTDSKAAAATFATEAVAKPTLVLDPITIHTDSTATFSGEVKANPPATLTPAAEAAFETVWHISCTPACPNLAPAGAGTVTAVEGSQPFTIDATQLEPNTSYEVTLEATNAGGTSAETATFTTTEILPGVKFAPGASDRNAGYTLQGVVNPHNSIISVCKFVYGPNSETDPAKYAFSVPCSPTPAGRDEVQEIHVFSTAGQLKLSFKGQSAVVPYNATAAEMQAALEALSTIGSGGVSVTSSNGFLGTIYKVTFTGPLGSLNVPPIHITNETTAIIAPYLVTGVEGEANKPVTVEGHVTGLTPGATYHARLVVKNGAGTVITDDQTFVPTKDAAQPCPNEQLRKENSSLALPECRAYEMVTPPNKSSFPANLAEYTEDGSSVAYTSQAGNIANSGYGSTASPYVADRTAAGWETTPNLNGPVGSPYSGPEGFNLITALSAYSADLHSSLWFARNKSFPYPTTGPRWYPYLRNPDGTFSLIGKTLYEGGGFGIPEVLVGSSSDLSHVVFNGKNSNGEESFGPGVYEFVGTGNDQPRRVDVDNAGNPICGAANGNAVSSDGRVIVVSACGSIWARVDGTTSYDVSATRCSPACASPEGPAVFQGAAKDGSRVYFTTTAQLINSDTDETNDLYACDIPTAPQTPTGTANSCSALHQVSGPAPGANVESVSGVSADGSTAYFTAQGVLAGNENALGEEALAGAHNLYVWRTDAAHPTGQTTFVARLDPAKDPFGLNAQTTADGRYLVFTSASQLVPTDTDNARDVYRYDADTGAMTRVSTNIFGVAGNAEGADASIIRDTKSNIAPTVGDHHSHPAVSDDGEAIVFTTREALSPLDGNGQPDVYLWKAGHVSLISTGAVGVESIASIGPQAIISGALAAIAGSGKDIYFTDVHQLTPSDGDDVADVYDARVDGGFPGTPPPPCSGETCQPPAPTPPVTSPSPANQPNGSGNVKPCPKNKVAKGNKCVKKPHKKHSGKKHSPKKNKRTASHGRGGNK